MEVFDLPRLATLVPYAWTAWRRADEARGGMFAGWERLHGASADPTAPADAEPAVGDAAAIPLPFELRCRTVLWDRLFTPVRAEDPNVGASAPPPPLGGR